MSEHTIVLGIALSILKKLGATFSIALPNGEQYSNENNPV